MARDKLVPDAVSSGWDTVIEEAEQFAAEYRDDGWEAAVVHPGDVTPLSDDPLGLDVLAPGDEFETVQALVEAHAFDSSHVYRQDSDGIVLVLTVFEATADDVAVLVPAFVSKHDLAELEAPVRESGQMPVHVRPLSDDMRTTFTVADPDLFFDQ